MKRIFLTGATGVMGTATLKELVANRASRQYDITVLARDTKKNRRKLKPYIDNGVKVIWGDLLDADSIARGVDGADIVLHLGGMVSPMADMYPEKTMIVNVGSAENIVNAARAKEKRGEHVALVYIGSVSQYGSRLVPDHWGACGDTLHVAAFDAYALSKVKAEKIFAESGVSRWVSLRQTGILHTGLLGKASDPISFHVPLRGVLEWVTDEDSGRLMERLCRDDVPDEFWCRYYNIGGGEKYRLTNYEFIRMVMDSIGCPAPEKSFDSRWFAIDNFHGMWYKDSDVLEEMFHFRSGEGPAEYFRRKKSELPWYFSLAFLASGVLIKSLMRLVAYKSPLGTMSWFKNNDEKRIRAFFHSREEWESLPGWSGLDLSRPSDIPPQSGSVFNPNGVDDISAETGHEEIARQNGGEYLGGEKWRCRYGHEFKASPDIVINGGHWCPECQEAESCGDI
ncbi:MAG: NAD(P)-dependent oxidoreductase [Muribaculaceae bacterium]|nr:NAD(P)-dependent oxidoreductase [Muribaculaceae bacterium]